MRNTGSQAYRITKDPLFLNM